MLEYLELSLASEGTFEYSRACSLLKEIIRALAWNRFVSPQTGYLCLVARPGGIRGFDWLGWVIDEESNLPPEGLCQWVVTVEAAQNVLEQFWEYVFPAVEQLGQRDSTPTEPVVDGDGGQYDQQSPAQRNDSAVFVGDPA